MKHKRGLLAICIIICLFSIANVSASDINDTVLTSNNDLIENEAISTEILSANPDGTFTDLANEIASATDELNLTRNYVYSDSDSDLNWIEINRNITINGNEHQIKGSEQQGFIVRADNVFIKNINFIDSSINWAGVTNGTLSDCSFVNYNYPWNVVDGGFCSNCIIINCSFINSYTYEYGGAICFQYSDYCTISDCSFMNCSVCGGGGAVYMQGDNGIITNCSFINCHAEYSRNDFWWEYDTIYGAFGGAICLRGVNGTISYCNFVNCSAWEGGNNTDGAVGGAISVSWDSENGVMAYCSFVNCTADLYGGAVNWIGPNGILSSCSFVNCSADQYAGGVYWYGDNGYVAESSFINCYTDAYGGGIYFEGADCTLIYPTFEGNSAQNGSDWYSVKPLTLINDTKIETVLIAQDMNAGYGVSKKLIVTLKDANDNIIIGKQVSIELNNIEYSLKTDAKGQVSLPTDDLDLGNHVADIAFAGDDIYNPSNATAKVAISKASIKLVAKYDKGYIVATVKDETGNPVSGLKVGFAINGVKYVTTDENGQAKYSLVGSKEGSYIVKVSAYGNDFYLNSNQKTVRFTFTKMATKLTAKYDANSKNIIATVKDANGNPISGLKVGFAIDGVKYVTTDENGQAKYSTADLADGTYKVTVQAYGNEIYKDSNKDTVTFTIGSKEQAKIYLRNALYFVLQTKIVTVTLWDSHNNPIAGKTVYINLDEYGLKYSGVTDEEGNAYIRVGVGFGNHPATVSFEGDDDYAADAKTGRVRVIKETPSLMLPGAYTKFKASDATKTINVYLKDRYNKPLLPGTKVFVTINGKQYVGSINREGIASVNIILNKAGVYDVDLYYTGNTAYNAVRKTTKITIV